MPPRGWPSYGHSRASGPQNVIATCVVPHTSLTSCRWQPCSPPLSTPLGSLNRKDNRFDNTPTPSTAVLKCSGLLLPSSLSIWAARRRHLTQPGFNASLLYYFFDIFKAAPPPSVACCAPMDAPKCIVCGTRKPSPAQL